MSIKLKSKKSRPISCLVASDKMDKSRVGLVERLVKHREYGKYIKRKTKIMFHDPKNETGIGDVVLIIPAKPRSHRKHFDLLKVLEKSKDQVGTV